MKALNPITFKKIPQDTFIIIHFEFEDSIEPAILGSIKAPDAVKEGFANKGVVISGRGPVWLFAYLTHFYHPTKFVATYDPRLSGAVIVESHTPEHKAGEIIPIDSKLLN